MTAERNTLQATVREPGSKGSVRTVRRAGLVPGVAYGHEVKDLVVSVDPVELERVLRTEYAYNAVFNLEVEGQGTHQVMVRELQFNSVKRVVTHVDFIVVRDGDTLNIEVPVEATGRSKGVAMGGRLDIVRRTVLVSTSVAAMPTVIEHDVTALDIGEQVYIDEMIAPEGSSFVVNNRYPVIRVVRRRGAKAAGEEDSAD